MNWVDIKKCLPVKSDSVLLWGRDGYEIYPCYEREHFEQHYKDITHWTPLPPPPNNAIHEDVETEQQSDIDQILIGRFT